MKKLFIVFFIVVILIIGTFGGTVLAARPDSTPVEIWEEILEKIGIVLENEIRIDSTQDVISSHTEETITVYNSWYNHEQHYVGGAHFSVTIWPRYLPGDSYIVIYPKWVGGPSGYNDTGFYVVDSPGTPVTFEFDASGCEIDYTNSTNQTMFVSWGVTVSYSPHSLDE